MEHHVDRPSRLGAWVLISESWYEYIGSNPDPSRFDGIAQTNAANENNLAPDMLYVVPIRDSDSALASFRKWLDKTSA